MVLQTCRSSDSFVFLLQAQDPDPLVSPPSPKPLPRKGSSILKSVTESRQQAIKKMPQIPKGSLATSLLNLRPNLKELQLSRAVSIVLQPSAWSSLTGSLFSKPSGGVLLKLNFSGGLLSASPLRELSSVTAQQNKRRHCCG